jgi:coenzyme F420-0:L-glutamate ligase/coenzyme F420-1:gamma-L-glutamate ligase
VNNTIAIIGGTGPMGMGLAYRWALAGRTLVIGSRIGARAEEFASVLLERVPGADVVGKENAAAAAMADIVVLTVPYVHHQSTLETIREASQGKTFVDATVPLRPPKVGRVQLPEAGCAALEAQRLLGEGVDVVAAFQNVGAHNLNSDGPIDCDILISGDKVAARGLVLELVQAAGMRGWHVGPLANSAAAEALTSVLIQINKNYKYTGAGIRITPGGSAGSTDSYAPDRVEMFALKGIPLVEPGQDLAQLIATALQANNVSLMDNDLLVVAQKVVSKAEGRVVSLAEVKPSAEAVERGGETDKDPALVQLILDESNEILRQDHGVIIVEHRLGFVMANAGIDQSNASAGKAILLPVDPDASAANLAAALSEISGRRLGVIVSDSIGRAWRNGTVGHALGVAGLKPLIDLRDTPDLFDRPMQVSEVGLADEIAAAASALMGQGDEAKPVVIVRGFPAIPDDQASVQALLRPKSMDLFR